MRRILAALVLLIAWSPVVHASSRILDYHSDITVEKDGSMRVVETIRVVAEGSEIKHGIYRDFPTARRGGILAGRIPFEITAVEREGQSEPWHVDMRPGGIVRLYIGVASYVIKRGEHTYAIHYTTGDQIGFFPDHDELYWNVTGNDWTFAIEKASATVRLPDAVPLASVGREAFTGLMGARGKDWESRVDETNRIVEFETTRELRPHEGLTIVVTWPKGYVHEPTSAERRARFLRTSPEVPWAAGCLFVVLGYYLVAWYLVGRDPKEGTIIPEFGPPDGIGPGDARYVHRMRYDEACFATALIDMAVKGFITIKDEDGHYTLDNKVDERRSALTLGERGIADSLLRSDSYTISRDGQQKLRSAVLAYKGWLKVANEGRVLIANRKWIIPGVILSVVAPILTGLHGPMPNGASEAFSLSLWGVCIALGLAAVVASWKVAIWTREVTAFVSPRGAISFSVFLLVGIWQGLPLIERVEVMCGVATVLLVFALLAINLVFVTIMKAPTVAGRRLMDRIEGFRMYLRATENDRARSAKAPEKTTELFERFLPYAIALGVESEWAKQFEGVLWAASTSPGQGYRAGWYSGAAPGLTNASGFASSLAASLTGTIGSLSGPGSAGGAGGGGGGGGGGGW